MSDIQSVPALLDAYLEAKAAREAASQPGGGGLAVYEGAYGREYAIATALGSAIVARLGKKRSTVAQIYSVRVGRKLVEVVDDGDGIRVVRAEPFDGEFDFAEVPS